MNKQIGYTGIFLLISACGGNATTSEIKNQKPSKLFQESFVSELSTESDENILGLWEDTDLANDSVISNAILESPKINVRLLVTKSACEIAIRCEYPDGSTTYSEVKDCVYNHAKETFSEFPDWISVASPNKEEYNGCDLQIVPAGGPEIRRMKTTISFQNLYVTLVDVNAQYLGNLSITPSKLK